jgi:hypothetical protein
VHRRLPTSPAWEKHTPGREEAPAAGTARALPGGSRQRRRRGEEEGEGSTREQIRSPLGRPRGDDQEREAFFFNPANTVPIHLHSSEYIIQTNTLSDQK